ncbi:MAG: DUF4124 domain-containing protein [Zoogloeaceae bacterium]|jgi:hypothetical protein|nr:DUF4124 domain-containing protein [Zoogloeaceae bacterium]
MQTRLIFSVLFVLAVTLPAHAEVYKWKDAQGNTVISDSPQPGSGKPVPQVEQAPPTARGAVDAPRSVADQELEFKKRQQEQKEAADKAAQEKAAASRNQANCERARQHLALLESGERIKQRLPNGETFYLNDQQRQQGIAAARQSVQSNCK